MGRSARRRWLLGIMAVFFSLSIITSIIVPPRQGPDESDHYNYVRSIAVDFRLPPLSDSLQRVEQAHQPPLYYATAAVPFALANAIFEQRGAPLRAVRLFGAFVGLLWIYFAYRLSRELFPKDGFACLFCTAFTSLLPSIVYLSSVVSNQLAVATFFTGSVWMMIRFVRGGLPTSRSAFLLGLFLALAMLTGKQGLVLLPVAAVVILLARRRQVKEHRPVIWRSAIVALLTVVAVSVWWLALNHVRYGFWIVHPGCDAAVIGGWLGLASHTAELLKLLYNLGISLFANFWMPSDLAMSETIQSRLYLSIMSTYTALGLCGIMIFLFLTRGDRQAEEPMDRGDILLTLAIPFLSLFCAIYLHTALVDKNTLYQGYLLLPAAGPVGAVLVAGYRGLSTNRRFQIWLMAFVTAVIGLLDVLSLLSIWSHYAF